MQRDEESEKNISTLTPLGNAAPRWSRASTDAFSLGDLSDPQCYRDPCDLSGLAPKEARVCLDRMILIRAAEEQIASGVEVGEIRCPCHLAIGQEAPGVGVGLAIRDGDSAFGAHRSHAHYLGSGGDLEALMAEVHGREDGCSRGMGGSMHLRSIETGLYGTVPIVGGTIPIASGAALAAKMESRGGVSVSFFGDGATEEGVLHETLNLASVLELPIVFVCEHNLFSSHLHISLRQPFESTCRFAEAHGVPWARIDGNDIGEIRSAVDAAFDHARQGRGPAYLEMVTYRWRGHVGHREDMDVGVKRSDELGLWKQRDPIRRLSESLIAAGELDATGLETLWAETRERVSAAWERASRAPHPEESTLLGRVWSAGART